MSISFAKFQPLISDGLKWDDYVANKEHFQSCGACLEPYSVSVLPPLLLECGHFMCEGCWNRYQHVCSFCNISRNVRFKNYTKLLVLESSIFSEEKGNSAHSVYNFAVKLNDSKVFSLQGVYGVLTFRQLFTMIPDFDMYEKALKGQIILSINDVGVIFQHIQKLPIGQYNEYLKKQKNKTRGALVTAQVRSNMICFNKRFDGGSDIE